MILSNSRIEKNSKIHFYEQDILLDDHTYSGNIQVSLNIDYLSPGIGIALVSDEGLSLKDDGETYLFRIGHSEYSIIRRFGDKVEVIENGPAVNIKPFKEGLKLQIKKINNRVYFTVNNKLLSKKYLPTDLDRFMVGYYSAAGNIINSVSIASEIPEGWVVNMNNTNGGYIKFSENAFTVTNCLDKAEVEQVKIKLKANNPKKPYYYLSYEALDEEGGNDFIPYIFKSEDIRYMDENKNILDKKLRFELKEDSEVSLKFVGTKGTIKNVQISDSKDDFYVGTDYEIAEIKESFIKIKTKDILKIEWAGTIHGTPEYDFDNVENEKFGIIRDEDRIYRPQKYGINIGKEYRYEYTLELKKNSPKDILTIRRNNEIKKLEVNILDYVIIFENMDSIIDKLLIYKEDGTIIDAIIENTKKQYVPSSVKSPIIVTAESGEPLELSASYRVIAENENIKYMFTNIEREIFEPSNRIRLTNKVSDKMDTVVVYGVLKNSETYPEKIMYSEKNDIKNINLYADSYETLRETLLYRVDKTSGLIVLTDKDDAYIKSKYKEIVVDYLKKDSYAINYKHDLGSYEVDISTIKNTKIYYDGISDESTKFANIQEYKLLNVEFKNSSYIVLREGER